MKIPRWASPLAVAGVAAAVAACVLGCGSQGGSQAPQGPSMPPAAYLLAKLPLDADVVLSGDGVYWRLRPESRETPGTRTVVRRIDPRTRGTVIDEWLTSVFAQREVSEWAVFGGRVVFIDTSLQRSTRGGSAIGTRVFTAVRGSSEVAPVSRLEWGFSSDTGAYSPAISGLAFDGRIAAWHDARSDLTRGPVPSEGADAGVFACIVAGQQPRRIPSSSRLDGTPVAVSGTRVVFVAAGSRALGALPGVSSWDAKTGASARLSRATAVDSLAASATTVVWKTLPAETSASAAASLWGYDIASRRVFALSRGDVGEARPSVSSDVAVWTTINGGVRGYDLRTRSFFSVLTGRSGAVQPDQIAVLGDVLVWTCRDGSTRVYGARLARAPSGLTVKPLAL